jgi:hypothetical protein
MAMILRRPHRQRRQRIFHDRTCLRDILDEELFSCYRLSRELIAEIVTGFTEVATFLTKQSDRVHLPQNVR